MRIGLRYNFLHALILSPAIKKSIAWACLSVCRPQHAVFPDGHKCPRTELRNDEKVSQSLIRPRIAHCAEGFPDEVLSHILRKISPSRAPHPGRCLKRTRKFHPTAMELTNSHRNQPGRL